MPHFTVEIKKDEDRILKVRIHHDTVTDLIHEILDMNPVLDMQPVEEPESFPTDDPCVECELTSCYGCVNR